METFHVFKHPVEGFQAVKEGFSWPAFWFTGIWAFVKEMWGLCLIIIGIIFIMIFLKEVFSQVGSEDGALLMNLSILGFSVFIGVKGNEWRRNNLRKRGFEQKEIVLAETSDAAIASVAKEAEGKENL